MKPLKTLIDQTCTDSEKGILTDELKKLYGGDLGFPNLPLDRPYTMVNFVTTMEGITSFNIPGHMGGGDISGFNPQDTFIMGLLRSVADGVAVGANTLRLEPNHLWIPSFISAEHGSLYDEFRQKMGRKRQNPLTIFVTGSGRVLPAMDSLPESFSKSNIETLIVTTEEGKEETKKEFEQHGYPLPEILSVGRGREVDLQEAFRILKQKYGVDRLLIEGGSRFNGSVIDQGLHHEVFLTIAPKVIGTSPEAKRPLFVNGFVRTPETAIEHELISSKHWENYLYNRYRKT